MNLYLGFNLGVYNVCVSKPHLTDAAFDFVGQTGFVQKLLQMAKTWRQGPNQ
jgi:hypothetical protein